MSSDESEYETAEEGEEWEDDAFAEHGFFLYVAEDGTRWFLPMYYRPEMDLLPIEPVAM